MLLVLKKRNFISQINIMAVKLFFTGLAILLLPPLINAQETVSADAENFFQKAMTEINPKHVTWIKRTAMSINSQNLDENAIRNLAKRYGSGFNFGNMDIEAMVMFIMMQATKSAEEDLKSMMAEMNAHNAEKKKIRDAQRYLDESRNRLTQQSLDSFKLLARPKGNTMTAVRQTTIKTAEPVKRTTNDSIKRINTVAVAKVSDSDVNSVKEQLRTKLDSMNEMSEMTSLRLQMMMDRRSKFISTLSNIMKKISDTQNTIIQNMK